MLNVYTHLNLAIFGLLIPLAALTPSVAGDTKPTVNNEQALLANARQLIFEGRRSGEGYFSADGARMIFQSEREPGNPFYQMYVLDLETGDTQRISTGIGKTTCGWIHPQGHKVMFASTHSDPNARDKQKDELDKRAQGKGQRYAWSFDEHYEIYEVALEAGAPKKLTSSPGYDAEGSWSPDGKRIAFASNRDAYLRELTAEEQAIFARDKSYFMDLYVMNADGTDVQRLTHAPGYDGGPFFSPDGRRLVWRRFAKDGKTAEVWSMNGDGSDQRQLTRQGVMSWAPFYHPSGDYLVYTNNMHGYANFELFIVDVEGRSKPVRVTHTDGFDGLPVFSPDGKRLAWASARTPDRKAQIFIADWNDAEARRLLNLTSTAQGTRLETASTDVSIPDPHQTSAPIVPADLRMHVNYLASEALEGRRTGTRGEQLATAYVAAVFEFLGLQPAGDDDSYFQAFDFTSGISVGVDNRLMLQQSGDSRRLIVGQDWLPLSLSQSGTVEDVSIVFAGYGIVAPAAGGFAAHNDYAGLDIQGKWVMLLRYLPEGISAQHRQHLSYYADLHYKAMLARDHGARGIVLVSGPNAKVKNQLVTLSADAGVAGTSIAAISVTDAVAAQILSAANRDLQALQDTLDEGKSVEGFAVPQVKLGAVINLRQDKSMGRNVLARLAAREPVSDSMVIVGAHVDHIGRGSAESLAGDEQRNDVHYGADDNASGVAALLEIAQYLVDQNKRGRLKLRHDIVFAAWSGEELGTIGSQYFTKQLSKPGTSSNQPSRPVIAYLNMDMIGRMERHVYLQGTGSSPLWSGEIERRNVPIGLPIVTQSDSYLPTDATPFYLHGVPILNAFTGAHPDYNTPRDTADKLNYEAAAKIARLVALITRSVASRDEAPVYLAMEKPTAKMSRRNLRAYMGTIPEYGSADVRGVKLNGVAKGGPAETGGLQAGDVIVELAGRKVENIYDYTYGLNALKVGQPVEVVVQRAGQRVSVSVTPSSRE